MARPTKFNTDAIKRIVEAIEHGATYILAAQYGGIGYSTFNEWMNTKPEFLEAVKAAEGRAAVGWLQKIDKASDEGAWQAAAWKLERRYPKDYGRTVTEHTGSVEHQIKGYVGFTPDEWDEHAGSDETAE